MSETAGNETMHASSSDAFGHALQSPQASDPQPLSKNQQKKLKKRELNIEKTRLKKQQEKAKRQQSQAKRHADAKAHLESLSDEQLAEWRAKRAEVHEGRRKARDERRDRLNQAMSHGQKIIVDLDFAELMDEDEIRSLVQQLSYCYGANKRAAVPANLIFTNMDGVMGSALRQQVMGLGNWIVTKAAGSYLDHFKDSKDCLVYLTADSSCELTELDPSKAYIVGGLVDRNRHKGACFAKAQSQGVATARLPIGDYVQLASSSVMCTNHVVEMLVKWLEVRDWEAAFKAVVPMRKRKGGHAVASEGDCGRPGNKSNDAERGASQE